MVPSSSRDAGNRLSLAGLRAFAVTRDSDCESTFRIARAIRFARRGFANPAPRPSSRSCSPVCPFRSSGRSAGARATIADTVEKVAERLTKLEMTVATGFHQVDQRFSAMSRKIDVNVEALRGDIQGVAETVAALAAEMRRTTDAIRQEHAADREILRQGLTNHADRLHRLERSSPRPRR